MTRTGDYWRVTTAAAGKLFGKLFDEAQLEISTCGNVLAAVSFLHGIASQELTGAELDHVDENYQVLITVRAIKGTGP